MVTGLEKFKSHFEAFSGQFVLIGGAACSLLMDEAGLGFRATKDLDIVLYIEGLTPEFMEAFQSFIKEGGYEQRLKSSGRKEFFRFSKPQKAEFPEMLELFSRNPDAVVLFQGSQFTPISIEEATGSLSAILLDNDYYEFVKTGSVMINGLPVLSASHLIPLKARAWRNFRECEREGVHIDRKILRKHRNDILRLYQLLSNQSPTKLPVEILNDLQWALNALREEGAKIHLNDLGIKGTSLDMIIERIRESYLLAEV